jgi:ribosomal protein S18 acetylase RimI-like enzyme
MLAECSDRASLTLALRPFGEAASFPLGLLGRPGPGVCRFWTGDESNVVVTRLGGNIIPLFRSGCGRSVAEWLRSESRLTQMIVPEPLGNELLEIDLLPEHCAPVRETLAAMRELRSPGAAEVRVASTEDSAKLAQLYRPRSFSVAEFMPFRERFQLALETGRFCYIECDGRPVAACHTLPESAGIGQVMGVITDPEYRGRGLGRAVVAGLCRMLLADGLTPRLFYETLNNTTASLYRSLGFEDLLAYLTIDFL